ncbi:glycoside hydrolase family 9 protein [Flavimobilis sp. GY10621]|uniref:Endoglucanase n=1 Tax=Flavimobilis rhizosphaerae TaxID=2775421 RepID=A0ABR9DSE1_9MICO|nr:glycoside hydrolase family 9 protein [Flavimobilis rhizosphaerae]MBD9700050.1 glycoside hydrolase family 9 protein [Flavimobilis rhizosphaerae]
MEDTTVDTVVNAPPTAVRRPLPALLALALAVSLTACDHSSPAPPPTVPATAQTSAPANTGTELLPATSFADGLGPWALYGTDAAPRTADGATCVDLPGGTTNPWDVGLTYNGLGIDASAAYHLALTASAAPATTVRVVVGEATGAYRTATELFAPLTPTAQPTEHDFTAAIALSATDGDVGQVAIQLGSATPFTFCISEASVTTRDSMPTAASDAPAVRVNQVGYLTHAAKAATVVTDAADPLPWTLDLGGMTVARGTTEPRGTDPSAGLAVHTVDLSAVTTPGTGYTLTVDGASSDTFAIGDDLYRAMRVDALSFFYPQRSGVAIDGAVAGDAYARPAGHADVGPDQGDGAVACLPAGALTVDGKDLYDGWTCEGTIDVTGGWYDAGDHGKYVVNGGIAVGQLMSTYERALHAPTGDAGALGDGTLRVPEHGDGVPDVLSEARWELEWMLTMQVPAGKDLAGMVHHKVHDDSWTGIPLLPSDDDRTRYVHRPSTAATLNLAAVAAQGARLFEPFDAAFAARLLKAARTAWAAAAAHPDLYAPNTNLHPSPGGGPYDDTELDDERYWAAVELFLTTGEDAFADALTTNPYHVGGTSEAFGPAAFDWGHVAAYARTQLATVPNALPVLAEVRRSVVDAAEATLARQATQPFGTAYVPDGGRYDWGSNGLLLNNLAVLVAAYDLGGEDRFRQGVLTGLDHLLGRNAMGISYVTGHGTRFAQNQHSRWYAAQADPSLPHPPAGTVSGGPNSDVPDPVSSSLAGCAPQRCYVDDIGAWGVNELTINWNSALAYVVSFAADQGAAGPA